MNMIFKAVNDETNEEIKFISDCTPTLEAGSYSIELSQIIDGKGEKGDFSEKDKFKTTRNFVVKGKRFNLDSSDIYSVYPQANNEADYNNCFPHVVLTNDSLPWTRDLGKDKLPWLALLIFREDEKNSEVPKIMNTTLDKLTAVELPTSTEKMLFCYDYNKNHEQGETETTQCKVIDIPASLFNQIVPSCGDIKYLSHVREVSVIKKSLNFLNSSTTHSLSEDSLPPAQRFSIIVGNRLLAEDGKYVVHLVSLENMANYLPDNDGNPNPNVSGKDYIRLFTLHNWQFTSKKSEYIKKTLSEVINGLNDQFNNKNPITLRLPDITEGDQQMISAVNKAYQRGYSIVSYDMRGGDRNIARYRGPLIPYQSTDKTDDAIKQSNNSPDSLLIYGSLDNVDPKETAMFDVSYATAYQLGMLLALQNKGFAQSLYNWKKKNTLSTIKELEDQILRNNYLLTSKLFTGAAEITTKQMLIDIIKNTFQDYLKISEGNNDEKY